MHKEIMSRMVLEALLGVIEYSLGPNRLSLGQASTFHDRETYARRANAAQGIFRRGSKVMKDLIELIDVTIARVRTKKFGAAITYSLPLKIGLPPSNSANMQPTDHTSIAVVFG